MARPPCITATRTAAENLLTLDCTVTLGSSWLQVIKEPLAEGFVVRWVLGAGRRRLQQAAAIHTHNAFIPRSPRTNCPFLIDKERLAAAKPCWMGSCWDRHCREH